MGFWIMISILLFVIVIVSTFGPMVGLYGEMKYKGGEDKNERSVG